MTFLIHGCFLIVDAFLFAKFYGITLSFENKCFAKSLWMESKNLNDR